MFIVVCWEGLAVVLAPWWDERVSLDSGLYLKLALTEDDLGGGFKSVSSQTWGGEAFLFDEHFYSNGWLLPPTSCQ